MSALTLTLNHAAFRQDVLDLLKGAPIQTFLENGQLKLKVWGNLTLLMDLARAVVASVEVVKANAIAAEDPEGLKGLTFDRDLALRTAIRVLDDLVVFEGPFGDFIERHDQKVLIGLINLVLTGLTGRNWTGTARAILGLGR